MFHPHFFLSHYLFRMPVLILLCFLSCGLRIVLLLFCLLIVSMLARSNSKRRREGRGTQIFVSCRLGCCCEPQRMVDETLLLDGVSNDKVVVYCYYLHIESRAVSDTNTLSLFILCLVILCLVILSLFILSLFMLSFFIVFYLYPNIDALLRFHPLLHPLLHPILHLPLPLPRLPLKLLYILR